MTLREAVLGDTVPQNAGPGGRSWFFIRGKWRIGFLAIRHINVGEELAYGYLDRGREQQWLWEGRLVDGRVVAGVEGLDRDGSMAASDRLSASGHSGGSAKGGAEKKCTRVNEGAVWCRERMYKS